ncbi:hypothetical protein FALBO_15027 [Fusarium albosuccineum]|uniref:2EXR domain-containing protein n=1 Tax=Fusarium albosuccineum TaxID=1237068 RepID=A0A8H4KYM3_9HYPO|nr:hypothetical protein FALBO_15027 [Fusarium albosuccineum]
MAEASGSSSDHVFAPFPRFPPELRHRIWHDALDEATKDRILSVNVYALTYSTPHSCLTIHKQFCGKHAVCRRYINGEPSHISRCMADGYFTVDKHDWSGPEGSTCRAGLQNISLACHEARQMVLSRYPNVLRVYPCRWSPGVLSRLVRCNPEKDVLHITDVLDMSTIHPDSSEMALDGPFDSLLDAFPQNASLFSNFRDIISSFQNVAFLHVGHRRSRSYGNDLAKSNDFIFLLFYFESLKSLYLRPDPKHWPDVYEDTVIVEEMESLRILDHEPRWDIENSADDFLYDYKMYAEVQNDHYTKSDEHWVSKPKPLEKVGCYAAKAWIPRRIKTALVEEDI